MEQVEKTRADMKRHSEEAAEYLLRLVLKIGEEGT